MKKPQPHTYFKLFQVDKVQVLFTREYDKEGCPIISIVHHFDGGKCRQEHGYNSEQKRDEMFATIDDKFATEYVKNIPA